MWAHLAAGDPWVVVAFHVTPQDWEKRGNSEWLDLSSATSGPDAEAAVHRVFLVRDGLLRDVGGSWGPVGGWAMGFTGDGSEATVVVLLIARGLAADADVELRLGRDEAVATQLPAACAVVASGLGAELARYEDAQDRERPIVFGANVTDDRTRVALAGQTVVGPGSVTITMTEGSGAVGFHVAEVRAAGMQADSWRLASRVGNDAREAKGAAVPARSLTAFIQGSGEGSEVQLALDASSGGAAFETSLMAFFVPWDPASAGFRAARLFEVPAAAPVG